MKKIITALIKSYQLVISPLTGPQCRFTPTCSQYCLEAIEAHGVICGLGLTVRRLCRCHPWHAGGEDPVPEVKPLLHNHNG